VLNISADISGGCVGNTKQTKVVLFKPTKSSTCVLLKSTTFCGFLATVILPET
jgi:hypothetical protein